MNLSILRMNYSDRYNRELDGKAEATRESMRGFYREMRRMEMGWARIHKRAGKLDDMLAAVVRAYVWHMKAR